MNIQEMPRAVRLQYEAHRLEKRLRKIDAYHRAGLMPRSDALLEAERSRIYRRLQAISLQLNPQWN